MFKYSKIEGKSLWSKKYLYISKESHLAQGPTNEKNNKNSNNLIIF